MDLKKVLLFLAVTGLAAAYDAQFDQFDAESAVKDPALLEGLMKCLANLGPCNEVSGAYKQLMPEVVMTTCAKCTPRQKEILKVVMGAAKKEFPDLYKAFKKSYDPKNKKGADLDAFVSH